MKKILVIAGGAWQVPLIRKIKSMGYEVYNSNLYENSPGFEYADGSYVADVLDRESNLSYAREIQADAVLTDESDIAVPTVAYVADKLGLNGIGLDKAALFTNKYLMRQFCKQNGFASPDYVLCSTADEAVSMLEKYGRIIIKPIDSQSSRGVQLITNKADLVKGFEFSRSFSHSESKVLAEQYVDGREFTVDAIVVGGKCTSLATSIKYQFAHNTNITQTLYFTNESLEYDLLKLKMNNDRLVEAMGLKYGLTHAEYKYENGQFYLIEIAARGGGTRISSHIVPLMSGIDNYQILINQALGMEINYAIIPDVTLKSRKAVLEFLDYPEGTVTNIEGLEAARSLPGVVEIKLEFNIGDTLAKPGDDRSRVGFFIAYAEDALGLEELRTRIKETLKVEIHK